MMHKLWVKPFKFFHHWVDDPDFLNLIQHEWDVEIRGTAMFRFVKKLQAVKRALKTQNFTSCLLLNLLMLRLLLS